MNNKKISLYALILCFLLLPILSSCNNSLDPVSRKKGSPYSIYGILDISSKANYIRVKNLDVPLIATTSHSINGTVRLINLKTGDSQRLTDDSLITFGGVVTHNFKSTLPINPITTYEVVVKRRSDGRKATARVTTPLETSVSLFPRTAPCGHTRTAIFKKVLPGEYIQPKIKFVIAKNTVHSNVMAVGQYLPVVHYKNQGNRSKPKSIKIQFNMKDALRAIFTRILSIAVPHPCFYFNQYSISHKVKFIFIIYRYIHKHISASDSIPISTSQLIGTYRDSTTFIVKKPAKQ